MLIGIDIGNTNITVGLFAPDRESVEPLFSWRFTTLPGATADELAAPLLSHLQFQGITVDDIHNAIVSTVVPDLGYSVKTMLREIFAVDNLHFVDHETDTGLAYTYPNPAEIGADRIVNAAAGIELYGAPLIIIDFGTATTFCCISPAGAYMGGQIMPGVGISLQALSRRAAKLAEVRLKVPDDPLGASTADSMVAGIFYQTTGAVEKAVDVLRPRFARPPRVLATGGFAALFEEAVSVIDLVDPGLTLKGLKIIHNRLGS